MPKGPSGVAVRTLTELAFTQRVEMDLTAFATAACYGVCIMSRPVGPTTGGLAR